MHIAIYYLPATFVVYRWGYITISSTAEPVPSLLASKDATLAGWARQWRYTKGLVWYRLDCLGKYQIGREEDMG